MPSPSPRWTCPARCWRSWRPRRKRRGSRTLLPCEAAPRGCRSKMRQFDFVASRFSAHHWRDFEQGLGEARRVAKAGSPAVFIDAFAPGSAMLDTHLQAVELLRDGSHVRDYTVGEWLSTLGRRGFALRAFRSFRLRMDFPVWIARMRTPERPRQRDPDDSGLGARRGQAALRDRGGWIVHARRHDGGDRRGMRGVVIASSARAPPPTLRIRGPWPADAASRRSNDYTTGLTVMNVSSECLVEA